MPSSGGVARPAGDSAARRLPAHHHPPAGAALPTPARTHTGAGCATHHPRWRDAPRPPIRCRLVSSHSTPSRPAGGRAARQVWGGRWSREASGDPHSRSANTASAPSPPVLPSRTPAASAVPASEPSPWSTSATTLPCHGALTAEHRCHKPELPRSAHRRAPLP